MRAAIREMYRQGLSDAVVRAQLAGVATPEGIRSSMSLVRQELGIVLRPDLCGPRSKRAGAAQRPVQRPVYVCLPADVLARLDDEAALRGLTRSALTRRIVTDALAGPSIHRVRP